MRRAVGFYRPPGGFFLWLDVGDSAAATLHLWQAQGVRVLPGAYLTRLADTPQDPASNYIRVALVAPPEKPRRKRAWWRGWKILPMAASLWQEAQK